MFIEVTIFHFPNKKKEIRALLEPLFNGTELKPSLDQEKRMTDFSAELSQ